ncbi:peroxide stress protein YaaA [Slackia heliotrinireducens]|uniref:peroxide stress protein YaaA n=1 Tax=Slackia heliotrinireducens TaxID=84110 RepID=UPI00331607BF
MDLKFIVSPAKKMNVDDMFAWRGMPRFIDRTRLVAEALHRLTFDELQKLWNCSDALAQQNFERLRTCEPGTGWDTGECGLLTPAIMAYEGIQYQNMAPTVMNDDSLEYIQDHLRILSGFYGMLRPFDAVIPYRLEMQAKLQVEGAKDLYAFWGSSLYDAIAEECAGNGAIINIASVEYSKAVTPHIRPDGPQVITCLFGDITDAGKLRQRSTYAKAARGSFVRWCAENVVDTLDDLRRFDVGYRFDPDRSTPSTLVFVEA